MLTCNKGSQQKGLQEYFRAADILIMPMYNLPTAVDVTELQQKCITLWDEIV